VSRSEYLAKAESAARRAETLAVQAESWVHKEHPSKSELFAATSAAWADVARTFVAIARALPADVNDPH